MSRADLLLDGIGELATAPESPVALRGERAGELRRIGHAAVAIANGRFTYVGSSRGARRHVRLRAGGRAEDLAGATVIPGLVDAHTHMLFAGDRADELDWKLRGMRFAEIARRGGGLYSTVQATRRASEVELRRLALGRIARMLKHGTTTAEAKSGYALSHDGELRLLRLIPGLARGGGLALVPTYLGAHAIPPGRRATRERYVQEIVRRTLPAVAHAGLARFCDVFCEPGFFTVDEARRILTAALKLGLGAKIHADEFELSGGARLAAELGARSAEHLLRTPAEDREALSRAGVIAVLLPATPFASLSTSRSPGREMVDAGVPVALGSDLCPNSWVESMPLVLAHAVYSARLTPAEAIVAATANAAHAIDAADRAGVIAVGRPADLTVFDVASAERIAYRIGSEPVRVYRQGIPVSLS